MLYQQLQKRARETAEKAPEEVLLKMQEATRELVQQNITENSLKEGNEAPEFSLPNKDGKTISSQDLKQPLIISFYRGSWCPFCNLEMAAWEKIYPEVKKAGAELIAISPNTELKVKEMQKKHNVEFELLSDLGNTVAKQFGLVFTLPEMLRPVYKDFGINIPEDNGDNTYEIPIPATYIIKDGKVAYAYVEVNHKIRAEPSEVLEALNDL